jgi:hypothetical protein
MSEFKIEYKSAKFFFLVNLQSITIDYNVVSKTVVIFRGVAVYQSQKKCISENDARAVLWEYLESIQYSEKKSS